MNRFSFFSKSLENNLKRLVTVVCVISLLFLTQACSGTKTMANSGTPDYQSRDQLGANAYDVKNSYEGGMNGFNDTDPRFNNSRTNNKAKSLVKNAERNFDNGKNVVDNIGDNLNKTSAKDVANNARRAASNIGDKVGNTAENLAKGTERGIENIKENVENTPEYLSKTAKQTTNNAL